MKEGGEENEGKTEGKIEEKKQDSRKGVEMEKNRREEGRMQEERREKGAGGGGGEEGGRRRGLPGSELCLCLIQACLTRTSWRIQVLTSEVWSILGGSGMRSFSTCISCKHAK